MHFYAKVEKWIHNAKPPLGPIASNEVDKDKTRPNVPLSYSLVRQLEAKQALVSLNSEHMSRREDLLHFEEELIDITEASSIIGYNAARRSYYLL